MKSQPVLPLPNNVSILKQPQSSGSGSSMTTIYGMETVPVENGKFDAVPYGYVEVNPLVADPNTPRVSRIVSGMVGNKSFYLKEIKDKPNVFGFELALQTVRVEIHRRRAGKRVSSHLKEMRRMRQEVEAIEL